MVSNYTIIQNKKICDSKIWNRQRKTIKQLLKLKKHVTWKFETEKLSCQWLTFLIDDIMCLGEKFKTIIEIFFC